MTKASDPNLEPFIDDLWYFDSVVSTKPPLQQRSPFKPPPPTAPVHENVATAADGQLAFSETQLPLSTGGESSPRATPYSSYYADPGSVGQPTFCGDGSSCMRAGKQRPSMCELVEKMEHGEGELPETELRLWMQKLGLEYTEDGAMIRRVPNADFGSQQKLDFSEFVCLNRFIEEECRSRQSVKHHGLHTSYSDDHTASLYEVFHLFDKDDTGLITPYDLCDALAKLGLRSSS